MFTLIGLFTVICESKLDRRTVIALCICLDALLVIAHSY